MFSRGADMDTQTYRFTWHGIGIEAIYTPLKWNMIAHLEIRSVAPEGAALPVSETGYRSHFHQPGTVEAQGGDVVAQVTAWLDETATSSQWRQQEEAAQQLSLF